MRTPAWQVRWRTMLQRLQVVSELSDAQKLLDALSVSSSPTVLGFVNAHAMNLLASNADYYHALSSADVLLRDGSGMSILLRRQGLQPGLNMNGTDFIPQLLAAFKGRRVAFWGTQEPFLSAAVHQGQQCFGVDVVSAHHGFDDEDAYLMLARQVQPELIVLGMGMPKQEIVAARIAALGAPCVIVCGGAILDFLGGKVTRAPQWVRRIGCEWLYRLTLEPVRLFKRYVLGNPVFLLRSIVLRHASEAVQH
jgi:N-acetylglucosaminyldiphosphoundecaprenol N-acetyl-beta-D-mannosaminyltransferase